MFAYGVMNAVKKEDTEIVPTYYKTHWTDDEAAAVNEEFDAVILPLADAFRQDFTDKLRGFTELIKRLTIPVIVIGAGLRAGYNDRPAEKHSFDDDVREFVMAVLDHSSMLGLRGERTGEYLKGLGFAPERDFTAIGCPSLYMYGGNVKTKPLKKDIQSLIFNANYLAPDSFSDFIGNTIRRVPEHYLIQQLGIEYNTIYFGKELTKRSLSKEENDALHRADRVRMFNNVRDWISFAEGFDLFVGNRFHGTAAAVLAGIPHIFVPLDSRTREMSEFHHITSISPDELEKGKGAFDYIDRLDMKSFERNHRANLAHYIDFLNANKLEHIFETCTSFPRGETPLEAGADTAIDIIHDYDSLSVFKRLGRRADFFAAKIRKKLGAEGRT